MPGNPHNPGTVAAHGPLKPQKFFHVNEQQLPPAYALDDGSDSWWAGVQQCAVGVALAATLAVTALATSQAEAVANSQQDELPQPTVGESVGSFLPLAIPSQG